MKKLEYAVSLDGTEINMTNIESIRTLSQVVNRDYGRKYEGKSVVSQKNRIEDGWIYLKSYEFKGKELDIHLSCFTLYFDAVKKNYKDACDLYDQRRKRLRHNIVSYNAKIQDELEDIIDNCTQNDVTNWRDTFNILSDYISHDPSKAARTIFHILKYVKHINYEIDVHDIVNGDMAAQNIEINRHVIHKVINLALQSFFLDFCDKKVFVHIQNNSDYVLIDYTTFSVVLTHIFDNAVKYSCPDSTIEITFEKKNNELVVVFEMESLFVSEEEIHLLTQENYSGHWARQAALNGNGIGMFYIDKLIKFSNGKMEFIPGTQSYTLNRLPYAHNKIELHLLLADSK